MNVASNQEVNLEEENALLTSQQKSHEMMLALQSKQFEVYEGLLASGIPRLEDKVYHKIMQGFDEAEKNKLDKIHDKFIKYPCEKHLMLLIERTRIYSECQQETSPQPFYTSLIAKAYEELNSIAQIRVCLKFVSYFSNLKISLDINQKSVLYFDSRANPDVNGRTSTKIDIGAKGFNWSPDSEETRDEYFKVLGVLAHELFHFAILFKYDNDYKPYHKNDDESKQRLEEVLEATCDKRALEEEDIIESALNAEDELLHDELIVCVPHLLARYLDNEEKFKQLKLVFNELFCFFDEKILPDLSKEIELMSAVSELKARELENLSQWNIFLKPNKNDYNLETGKVLEISSNYPQLTLHIIYQQMQTISTLPTSFIFLRLRYAMQDMATIDLVVKAFGSCMKPTFVFDCENEQQFEVTMFSNSMETKGIKTKMIFVHDFEENVIENAAHQKLFHSWEQLEDVSKKSLIERNTNFQGKQISLDKIFEVSSKALDQIPLNLLLNNRLVIGKELDCSASEIYIGRRFSNGNVEIKANQLVENAKNDRVILLSDDAGMGKTTELMMLAAKVKESLPSYWVTFIDLKMHYKSYDKGEEVKTVFNSADDIGKFVADKVLGLNSFEGETFRELFRRNRVVLLMDGFDEICPSFNVFMTNLLKAIENQSNILFISTRPHHKQKLENQLNATSYTFCPWTDENCQELIKATIMKTKFPRETYDEIISSTIDFLSRLDFIERIKNPMLLSMVTKVFTSGEEIGKDKAQLNMFWIYKKFVNIMIAQSFEKGFDAKREHADATLTSYPIMRFYQKEALKVLFFNEVIIEELFEDFQTPHEDFWPRNGLVSSDGSGNIQFIHQTFAEFLVADFLVTNLFGTKNKFLSKERKRAVETLFKKYATGDEYWLKESFLDGAFGALLNENSSKIDDSLFKIFVDVFDWAKFKERFTEWIFSGRVNLMTVASRGLRGDRNKFLEIWFDGLEFTRLASLQSLDINKKLFCLVQDILDENDFREHLVNKHVTNRVITDALRNNDPRVADFYCDRLKNLLPAGEYSASIKKNYYPLNTLRKHLRSHNLSKFQEEIDQIKREHGLDYLRKLLIAKEFCNFKTICFEACEVLHSLDDFLVMWDLFKKQEYKKDSYVRRLFNTLKNDRVSLLMCTTKKSEHVFMAFWKLISAMSSPKSLLMATDFFGYNVLYHATQSTYPDTFIAVKKLYLEIFGEYKIKKMLVRQSKKTLRNILWFASAGHGNLTTFKALWEFLQDIHDENYLKSFLLPDKYFQKDLYYHQNDIDSKISVFDEFIKKNMDDNEVRDVKSRFER